MKYRQIASMQPINDVDESKVENLINSMRENGYVGCPILVCNDQLLTGSHRKAALEKLSEDEWEVYEWEVAEDVTELVEAAFEKFEEENGWARDIDYSDIGWIFEGTWVEEYKNEIEEW